MKLVLAFTFVVLFFWRHEHYQLIIYGFVFFVSLVGAAIGIIGTSINNYLRMRELRGIVSGSAEGGQELR